MARGAGLEGTGTNLLGEPSVGAIVLNYRDITSRKRVADALTASEADFRALFAAMTDVVLVMDSEGRYLQIAPTNPALLYKPPDELLGRTLHEVLPETDADNILRSIRRALELQQPIQVEYGLTIGGAKIWFDGTISPMGADKVFWIARDITEHKQAMEALRASEQRFRGYFELGLIGMTIATPTRGIIEVNAQLCDTLGYERSELLHKTWAELTHPDDLAADAAKFDQVTAGIIDSYSMDKRYIRKDGRAIDTTVSVRAMRKTDGAVDYFVALVQDISERKRSEAAEREQRTLAEALRDTAEALNSTRNFDEVLERILTNVQRVVPHDTATLILVENGIGRVVGGRGFASDAAQAVLRLRLPVDELPNLRRAMQSGEPAIIADTRSQPDWMSFPETRWIRSNISAPIRQNEQVIGLLNLDSAIPNHFTAAHKERLIAFAAQAAVALENARLLKETQQQLGELEALNAVSTALRSAQTLDQMLPILLDATLAVLHANTGAIRLYDPQRDELQAVLGRGWFAQRNAPLQPGQGIVGQVFSSGKAYISRELRLDPQADPQAVQSVPAGWGGACVPIRSAEAIVGVLFVAVELPRELSASEVQLLTTISEMAGTAIQRMSLHEQTTRRLQRLMILQTIERTISSSLDVRLTLKVLLDQLVTQLGVDAADVLLRAPATHMLEHAASLGYAAGRQQPLRLGEGLAGEAALERKIMTSHADEQKIRATAALQPQSINDFAVQVAIPLVAKAEVKGVLRIFQRAAFSPDREWLDFMEMLAGQVAIAIDNSQLFVGAQRSNLELALAYDTTLEGWSRALDLRDKETEGPHAARDRADAAAGAHDGTERGATGACAPRGAPARHGQDGRAGRHPAQAGPADGRGMGYHAQAPGICI